MKVTHIRKLTRPTPSHPGAHVLMRQTINNISEWQRASESVLCRKGTVSWEGRAQGFGERDKISNSKKKPHWESCLQTGKKQSMLLIWLWNALHACIWVFFLIFIEAFYFLYFFPISSKLTHWREGRQPTICHRYF